MRSRKREEQLKFDEVDQHISRKYDDALRLFEYLEKSLSKFDSKEKGGYMKLSNISKN